VLQTKEESEEDGNLIVESIERCFVVFVFTVQGPDVRRDQVEIILWNIVSKKSEKAWKL
jgi:hypothetical protein